MKLFDCRIHLDVYKFKNLRTERNQHAFVTNDIFLVDWCRFIKKRYIKLSIKSYIQWVLMYNHIKNMINEFLVWLNVEGLYSIFSILENRTLQEPISSVCWKKDSSPFFCELDLMTKKWRKYRSLWPANKSHVYFR